MLPRPFGLGGLRHVHVELRHSCGRGRRAWITIGISISATTGIITIYLTCSCSILLDLLRGFHGGHEEAVSCGCGFFFGGFIRMVALLMIVRTSRRRRCITITILFTVWNGRHCELRQALFNGQGMCNGCIPSTSSCNYFFLCAWSLKQGKNRNTQKPGREIFSFRWNLRESYGTQFWNFATLIWSCLYLFFSSLILNGPENWYTITLSIPFRRRDCIENARRVERSHTHVSLDRSGKIFIW